MDTNTGELDGSTLSGIKNLDEEFYDEIKKEIGELSLPPGSAIAGVYAHVDKIPGSMESSVNIALEGVIGPLIEVSNEEQNGLNINPVEGKSVNAIRSFEGRGTVVWGARTLAGKDNEWRCVPG